MKNFKLGDTLFSISLMFIIFVFIWEDTFFGSNPFRQDTVFLLYLISIIVLVIGLVLIWNSRQVDDFGSKTPISKKYLSDDQKKCINCKAFIKKSDKFCIHCQTEQI